MCIRDRYDAFQKAKDKPGFKAKHEAELVIFEAARSTLLAMQGDEKLPLSLIHISYTEVDLNWMDKKARSPIEMNDPASRPEIDIKRDNKMCIRDSAYPEPARRYKPRW